APRISPAHKPCLQQGGLIPKKNGSKKTYRNLIRNPSVPSAPPPCLRGFIKPTFYFLLLPWLFSPQNSLCPLCKPSCTLWLKNFSLYYSRIQPQIFLR